ncbi:murein transglycosylase [Vibrio nigripulchritudo]|uniref:murein transglycosylase n=1 Tax=Vibrio nigripulchritudo TaxID=28173 RepID=UPI00190AFB81|nr:murein transglycosylase [Vibrio nigripulchritudo]BCL71030.1 murein transglycosylase [Vibrio nigripulchritudo]BDU32386.1 murein transglycosylase [Vibrio nigripulchritudo]
MRNISKRICVAYLGIFSAFSVVAENSDTLIQKRLKYAQAQSLLDARKVEEYQSIRPDIADYVLTPYTDYRAFLVDIGKRSIEEVSYFQKQHYTLPFSKRIRASYLDGLAKEKDWETIFRYQTTKPRGETYQCYYYYSQLIHGDKNQALKGAESLWLSGSSVSSACDDLFEAWQKAGLRTDDKVLDRMVLAYEARKGRMLTYLKKLPESKKAKAEAEKIAKLYRAPQEIGRFAKKSYVTPRNQKLAWHGYRKLARANAEEAVKQLNLVVSGQKLTSEQRQQLADYTAFRLINTDSEELITWRDKTIAKSSNSALIERRVRLALQHADWKGVKNWIAKLPDDKKSGLRWQYWFARSEIELGETASGEQRLESLLGKRHFYSVVAAQTLGAPIKYDISKSEPDSTLVTQHQVTLDRVHELIALDKIAAAKSEWQWLLQRSSAQEKKALAHYASNQKWSHLTVKASIAAKVWDEIHLRFPIAHRWWFEFYGDKYNIEPITLMSLARQESALDVQARSPVGARGIMQIMPATAKYTARKFGIPYKTPKELNDVKKNIEIGSQYLSYLLDQYDGNRIYAFAAYNAGPHRVKRWRENSAQKLDVFAFIEAIPFKETRGYVQNILMFESYYRFLSGTKGDFLTKNEKEERY